MDFGDSFGALGHGESNNCFFVAIRISFNSYKRKTTKMKKKTANNEIVQLQIDALKKRTLTCYQNL